MKSAKRFIGENMVLNWRFNVILTILTVSSVAFGADTDAIEDKIKAAKAKHTSAVSEATRSLSKVCDDAIKKAAASGDLAAVKNLISVKEAFESLGVIPTDPSITEDAIRYINSRRLAASELYAAYQSAIKEYTSALKIETASKLDEELKLFVAREQQAISLGKQPPNQGASTNDPMNLKRTKERFAEFYEEYVKAMDKVQAELTTAKKEQANRDMAKKMDDALKLQTWEFHCEITNVKETSNGDFVLLIEAPLETPGFREQWQRRVSVQNLKLSRQQALELVPGDVFVVKGTPRFTSDSRDQGTAFFSQNVTVGDDYCLHSIHLTNFKFTIEKQAAEVSK